MLDFTPQLHIGGSEASEQLRRLHAEWAGEGRSLLDLISDRFTPWVHYSSAASRCAHSVEFFYHRHDELQPGSSSGEGGSDREHGHFHVFMSPAEMPPGLSPLVLPELAVAWPHRGHGAGGFERDADGTMAAGHVAPGSDLCHLVGIGLDHAGRPIRMFTTNRWVTGETWYVAADVIAMLDKVLLAEETALGRWLAMFFRAYRPQIETLFLERDCAIAEWRRRRRGCLAYEDRRLVTPSSRAITL